jgi:hypothetical protein
MEMFTFRARGMGEALGIIARKIKDDEDRAKPPLAQLFGEMKNDFEAVALEIKKATCSRNKPCALTKEVLY